MPIRVTDQWRYPSRGTPEQAIATFRRWGSFPIQDVEDAVREMYRLGEAIGLDAALLVAHAALETGDRNRGLAFLSPAWATVDSYRDGRNRYNISGMGITDGGDLGYRWANGVEAARAHVVHHAAYEIPLNDPAWEVLRPYIHLDKRYDAIPSANRGAVATVADMTGKWWTNRDGHINLASRGNSIFPGLPDQRPASQQPPAGGNEGRPDVALTFGRVPMPGYVDLQHTTAGKPEGVGWDNLGKRDVLGIVLHRMWGTLRGTDSHFANPSVGSLTDYGIGTANIDGAALDGVIHKYNDPLGYRSGWASGRVSAPYGDGKKFVDKYGVNAVNKRLVSIETSGYDNDIFTDVAWGELVKLVAYYADQCKVPYTSLPLNPHTGINFIIWHEEITYGTGKKCPFTWMKNNTPRLYQDVIAYLKPFQTGESGTEQPKPETPPVEKPTYAEPKPIAALIPVADADHDTIAAIATRESDDFIYVGDRVEAVRETPRLQYAMANAKHTGPMIKAGEQFDVDYMVKAADGNWYYITGWWTRVKAADTKRISDAPQGAKVA